MGNPDRRRFPQDSLGAPAQGSTLHGLFWKGGLRLTNMLRENRAAAAALFGKQEASIFAQAFENRKARGAQRAQILKLHSGKGSTEVRLSALFNGTCLNCSLFYCLLGI